MICGSVRWASRRHAGHWKSDQISTVTGAFASPSVRPSVRPAGTAAIGARSSSVIGSEAGRWNTAKAMIARPTASAPRVMSAIGERHGGVGAGRAGLPRGRSARSIARRSRRVSGWSAGCLPVVIARLAGPLRSRIEGDASLLRSVGVWAGSGISLPGRPGTRRKALGDIVRAVDKWSNLQRARLRGAECHDRAADRRSA